MPRLCLGVSGKGQRLWGNPAWHTHIWGMVTWAVINGGLWFCFVWWLIGRTHLVWVICAAAYAGVILFHGVISSRFGWVHFLLSNGVTWPTNFRVFQ